MAIHLRASLWLTVNDSLHASLCALHGGHDVVGGLEELQEAVLELALLSGANFL